MVEEKKLLIRIAKTLNSSFLSEESLQHSPEARQVAFAVPSNVYPSGQRYKALWPSLLPSRRSRSGGGGSTMFWHMETATTITMLFVSPRGVAQVYVPESPI